MNVEARITQLNDALCKQLHSVHTVAEDDALINVELGEQSVKAMHLHIHSVVLQVSWPRVHRKRIRNLKNKRSVVSDRQYS
jgi:hypothetical protein